MARHRRSVTSALSSPSQDEFRAIEAQHQVAHNEESRRQRYRRSHDRSAYHLQKAFDAHVQNIVKYEVRKQLAALKNEDCKEDGDGITSRRRRRRRKAAVGHEGLDTGSPVESSTGPHNRAAPQSKDPKVAKKRGDSKGERDDNATGRRITTRRSRARRNCSEETARLQDPTLFSPIPPHSYPDSRP